MSGQRFDEHGMCLGCNHSAHSLDARSAAKGLKGFPTPGARWASVFRAAQKPSSIRYEDRRKAVESAAGSGDWLAQYVNGVARILEGSK